MRDRLTRRDVLIAGGLIGVWVVGSIIEQESRRVPSLPPTPQPWSKEAQYQVNNPKL